MPRKTDTEKLRSISSKTNFSKRHKKNDHNYREIRDSLVNSTGKVRSNEENALIIQTLAYFQNKEHNLDEACKEAMTMFGGNYYSYYNLYNYYIVTILLNISLIMIEVNFSQK